MRALGRSNISVAPLAFGTNVFGWTVSEKTAFALLDVFVGEGFQLIDTANVYPYWAPGCSGGESESIIGNWLRKRPGVRSKVVLATKAGFDIGKGLSGLARASITEAIDASLQRLNTTYIDVYQSHIDDFATPMEETLEAYGSLCKEGKIRIIGASNHTSDRLAEALRLSEAHGYPRYESYQPLYNLYDRAEHEGGIADICREHSVGVIPYFALASGFLTGKYRSEEQFLATARGQFAKAAYDTKDLFFGRGKRILDALDLVAKETCKSPAQVSIAWLLAQGVVAPIASATNIEQLHDLITAARLNLSRHALELLDAASFG